MARKISATFFMPLDGVIGEPQTWSFPFWNDEPGSVLARMEFTNRRTIRFRFVPL